MLDFTLKRIDGTEQNLGAYRGQVLLLVNVASKCGLTPQYDGLEALYAKYRGRGFAVLGFPANDFAGQEPGSDGEIADFCRSTYGVEFPMFSKITREGGGPAPALPEAHLAPRADRRRGAVELPEVPGEPERRGGREVRSPHRARRSRPASRSSRSCSARAPRRRSRTCAECSSPSHSRAAPRRRSRRRHGSPRRAPRRPTSSSIIRPPARRSAAPRTSSSPDASPRASSAANASTWCSRSTPRARSASLRRRCR